MRAKFTLIACAACVLSACAAPTPETMTPVIVPSDTPIAIASPILPTETPSPTLEPAATPVPWLATILERGNVNCGVDPMRPDYDATRPDFDIDVCRAIASALFNDPDAYDVFPLDLNAAAAALRAGEIDVYIGPNDQALPGIVNGPTLFIDATGAIARADVGIRTIADLKFATVCLMQDTIDERLFNEAATAARVTHQPLLFNPGDFDAMYSTYDQGHCDAVVDNRIRLWQRLPTLTVPSDHDLIDLVLTIGSRGPITPSNDVNWSNIVAAIGNSLIRAEELGVDSAGIDAARTQDDTGIRELLGVEGDIGHRLGLSRNFAAWVVEHVGNLGEIYARHFGALPRGPNALVKDGGLIDAPPPSP
ncbi:MAG TPA: hypothetical protein VIK33_01920 [Anaerolineae bacterium]